MRFFFTQTGSGAVCQQLLVLDVAVVTLELQTVEVRVHAALLDELIMAARTSEDQAFRKSTYKACLDIILDWAVEVPTYQRQNAIIFSTERVNMETITPDITTFYGWMAEVQNMEMN